MATRDRSARSLFLAAARSVLLALAAAWAVWLVAAQVLLWTPLFKRLLNAQSPGIHVEYRSAWSVWPGTVHARGLLLTGQDRGVQWRLAIEEVRSSIALGQLLDRVFHATQVRARGVAFALRRRIPPRELTPLRLRGLPQIENVLAVPVKEEGPEDDLPDSRYRLFSVWLEDVAGEDVRQIWIDSWRVDGAGEVRGAFYLKPVREVLVAPGELQLHGADVHRADVAVAQRVEGLFRVRLGPFDPRRLTAERFFRTADADADLRGEVAGLEVLGMMGGAGPARVSARVRRGVVEQADIAYDAGALAAGSLGAESARLRILGDAALRADLRLDKPGLPGGAARAESARLQLSGDRLDFGALRPPRSAAVDVLGGRIASARALGARLFRGHRVLGGTGSFSAHLRGPLHALGGVARVSLAALRVRARDMIVRGNARVDARIAGLDPRRGADLAGTRISVDQGRLVPDQEISPGWWGRAVLTRARLRFDRPRLDADLRARCRDARPIVGVYARLSDLPGFLNSLFAMDGLLVHASAHAGRGWLVVPEVRAEGNDASMRATLRRDGPEQEGAAILTARGLSVALDLDGGGSSLHLFTPGDYFAERQQQIRSLPMGRRAPRGHR